MLDRDIAVLYGVETRVLNQAVRRNLDRFPPDFMLTLSADEVTSMTSQSVISSLRRGGQRKGALAFTEHGVAMLSGILQSPQAVQVNIAIMRAFNRLREAVALHAELSRRIGELEMKYEGLESRYNGQFARVFDALRELMRTTDPTREPKLLPG